MTGVFMSVAFALALLLGAGGAQAQTAVKLVGNTGQPNGSQSLLTSDYAQAFTTGGHVAGYTLTRVDIQVTRSASAPTYTVAVHSDSSGSPGASLTNGTLTNPASLSPGLKQFTASGDGIDLAATTTYWVVVDVASGGNATELTTTASDSESGETGWSIADDKRSRNLDNTGSWTTRVNPLKIAVHGSEKFGCSATDTAVSWASGTLVDLVKDCITLLKLKDTLRGTADLNWAKDTKMNEWNGLTHTNAITGTTPRVKSLSLASKSPPLSGSIPAALGDLGELTGLYLQSNQLSGPIPKELGDLGELTTLILSDNQLSGPIPKELGDLESLSVSLSLENNQLSGPIPKELGNLDSLRSSLSLRNNQLSGPIPKELGNLDSLSYLWLNENQLSGPIPARLNEMTSLRALSLQDNQLTSAPDLSGLSSLTTLYLHNNRLTEVGSLPSSLTRLALSGNQLMSTPDLSNLASVTVLWLNNNKLTSVGSLPSNLTTLHLSNNRLTSVGDGDLPTSSLDVSDLTSLTKLYLNNNKLTSVANLPSSLTKLYLDDNKLRSVANLPTSLTDLYLSNNQLTSIAVNSLTSLKWLNLQHNQFENAPDVSSLSSSLTRFWLYGNEDLDLTTLNPPQPPTVDLSVVVGDTESPTTVDEDAGTQTVTVTATLSAKVTSEVALLVGVSSGTADAGRDYMAPAATTPVALSIPASTQTTSNLDADATTEITIIDDQQREGDETFKLELEVYPDSGDGLPATVQPGDTTAVTVTIKDNDSGGGGGGGGSGGSSGGGGRGGGRGGGGSDRHGNNAARATPIAFRPASPRAGSIAGQINTRSDVDYFRLRLAQAGVLVIETNGSTDTRGTVWQAGETMGAATDGGPGTNFRLATPVEAGDVVIAIAGEGGRTGGYTLRARLVVSHLENPSPTSFQSGLGLISGWVCEAEGVTVEIEKEDGEVVEVAAAYGTERADTAAICGDSDNGFGVLVNWNLLGDGEHAIRVLVNGVPLGVRLVPGIGVVPAVVDEIEIGRAPVTVTTLGEEFRRGLAETFVVADFPRAGEQMQVVWQESQQNFVLAPAELAAAPAPTPGPRAIEGELENPAPASYQSGIGVISGWVCAADAVVIEIDGQPIAAAAGTERGDTLNTCGDVDTGFGLLVNWAEFGAGEHEVVALVDGVELSRATVTVTVVDETEPYVRGLAKRVELPGFPTPAETVTLEWQQSQQNFVITGVD